MDEGLVAVEQAMPSGEQVAFQPPLTEMLAEDLHDPAIGSQVLVNRKRFRQPGLAGDVIHRAEPVGRRLVGTHDPEVVRVLTNDVAQERAQHLGGFVKRHVDRRKHFLPALPFRRVDLTGIPGNEILHQRVPGFELQ